MTATRRRGWTHVGWVGVLGLVTCLVLPGLSRQLDAQQAERPVSYTAAQADRGVAAYAQHCASCHGQYLDDGQFAPPLKGVSFRQRWAVKPADALFTQMSTTMPPALPGTLGDAVYAQLMAYILQENGLAPGAQELPGDPGVLKGLAFGALRPSGGGVTPGAVLPPIPARANPLEKIRSVTAEMLTSPPESSWLSWRRTYDAVGYSPLAKINRNNVGDLRAAWSWSLPNGPNEATPLVHDGVMFIHSYGDKVQALDAATGDLLWQYSRRLPAGVAASVKRSIALFGTRLYVATSDARMVALEVKTGRVVWDQAVADPKGGYRMTGGPLVARGKVFVGTVGRLGGGNYIAALDAETGKEVWRFNTIAHPGEPGGNSWNDLSLEKRNGGSIWIPGSYDPVHNLVLFGPGNTYDTAPIRDPVNKPGVTNDALYLDTTLALNADTGKLVWHFQHQTNGQWDLDWAFERQVIQLTVNGTDRRVVVTGGKQMIFDVVDAETGKYVSSVQLTDKKLQNVVTGIDPKTGAKIIDPTLVPGDGQNKMVCPHVDGGRDWMPTSYDPATRLLFVPMVEACMDMVVVPAGERASLTTGVRWMVRPPPDSDGNHGRLQAVNLQTGKTAWVARQRAPLTSGVLATAGGLVFVGSLDRVFAAYDAQSGAQLWKTRLNDVPASVPIAYSVNGTQYIATVVGPGGSQSTAYTGLVPELSNPPDHGAAVWVFEVPVKSGTKSTR